MLRNASFELHVMLLAISPHRQLELLGQGVHARDADTMQAARHFVRILVKLATGMQLGHHDLGGAPLGLMFVIPFNAGRDTTTVVCNRDGIIGVNRDVDFGTVTCQRLIDGVVEHLEHQMMQAGAIGRVTNIHAGALADSFQTFENLNR